jgi:MFS family permease
MGDLDATAAPPTRVRYGVLAYLCALCFVLYIDRVCISKAAPSMQDELGISNTAMGVVFGAFTLAYALFEVPTGRMGDRHGSRKVLVRIVLWWSAFTALTGCVFPFVLDSGLRLRVPAVDALGLPAWEIPLLFNAFLLLLLIRFLFGAGEAGALPNVARVLSRWFPSGRRGPAQGLITTANLTGGAVAPVVTAYLIRGVGWRWSFAVFGALGVVWAFFFYRWFRDDPAEHPSANQAERDLIRAGTAAPPGGEHPPIPWGAAARSPNVWLLGGVLTCSAAVAYMYFSWYASYLEKGRHVRDDVAGWLTGLVLAGGAVGSLLGGALGDWLYRATGSRRWSLSGPGAGGLAVASVCLAASVRFESPLAAAALTSLAFLASNVQLAAWWAAITDISGRHLGALFGLLNSVSMLGAIASQVLLGRFVDWRAAHGFVGRDQWDPAFPLYAGLLAVAAVGWLAIDASRPVEPAAPDERLVSDAS